MNDLPILVRGIDFFYRYLLLETLYSPDNSSFDEHCLIVLAGIYPDYLVILTLLYFVAMIPRGCVVLLLYCDDYYGVVDVPPTTLYLLGH